MKILFLHHSTGKCIWQAGVQEWFAEYNRAHGSAHDIEERVFPKKRPYGWNNYPFDYWNIWVRNAGSDHFLEEPTLELLTQTYDLIVFKHCYPVSEILPDTGAPSVSSNEKRIENYRLQYAALQAKLRSFPDTQFLLWTGPALTRQGTTIEDATRAREFFDWVTTSWLEPDGNVFLWDFRTLQTGGGLFCRDENAEGPYDPHPSADFARRAAPDLCRRIIEVLNTRGSRAAESCEPATTIKG